MLQAVCFLLLMAASVEDYRKHRVSRWWTRGVFLLGLVNIILEKENRWVTVTLTCVCLFVLYLLYRLVLILEYRYGFSWTFGGADVRLIPAMMLVLGWEPALVGVLLGFLLVAVWYLFRGKEKQEIPLVPWMTAGWLMVQVWLWCFA